MVAVRRQLTQKRAIELGLTADPIAHKNRRPDRGRDRMRMGLVNRVVSVDERDVATNLMGRTTRASKAWRKQTLYRQLGPQTVGAYALPTEGWPQPARRRTGASP
jgi:hypothetical protein